MRGVLLKHLIVMIAAVVAMIEMDWVTKAEVETPWAKLALQLAYLLCMFGICCFVEGPHDSARFVRLVECRG